MLVLLSGVAAGLGLGLLRGGRPANLGQLRLRVGGVFILALLAQSIAVRLAPNAEVPLMVAGGMLVLSYLAILLAIWHNRWLPGLRIIGVGVLLNVAAALPHGGLMPVTPEALRMAGRPVPDVLPPPGARPYVISKDVVLPGDQIPLWAISDRFVIPDGWPLPGVFSPGDVVVAVGLAWLLAKGMASGRRCSEEPDIALSSSQQSAS